VIKCVILSDHIHCNLITTQNMTENCQNSTGSLYDKPNTITTRKHVS